MKPNALTVLILAGGDSSRFWPLGDKNLFSFAGLSILHRRIHELQEVGIEDFVVIIGKRIKDSVEEDLKLTFPHLTIDVIIQTNLSGMAGAILSAKEKILGRALLITSPSDIFEPYLISDFMKVLRNHPDGIIAGIKHDSYFPGGYVSLEGNVVKKIVEKPDPKHLPSNIVTFVFDYFKNADKLVEYLQKTKTTKDDHFEKALDSMIAAGHEFRMLSYNGFWGYLKYPWHVLNLTKYYLANIKGTKGKNVKISDTATLVGEIQIADDVQIMEYAKIIGPTILGRGTVVGNNTMVRESLIGQNCVIGFQTEIARSYVGDNCWFHSNYIGDSVISNNVSMGAGTVLANFNLNESAIMTTVEGKVFSTNCLKLGAMIGKNVRIGVNVSLMPGVKIGTNVAIGPGVVLPYDVPDNRYCSIDTSSISIKKNKLTISKLSRESLKKDLVKK